MIGVVNWGIIPGLAIAVAGLISIPVMIYFFIRS